MCVFTVCTREVIVSLGWCRLGVGVIGLRVPLALVCLCICCARGGFYGIGQASCFWKALLALTNFAKASMPFLVLRIIVSLWSGAPSLIRCLCSSCISHSNSMWLCIWVSAPQGHSLHRDELRRYHRGAWCGMKGAWDNQEELVHCWWSSEGP